MGAGTRAHKEAEDVAIGVGCGRRLTREAGGSHGIRMGGSTGGGRFIGWRPRRPTGNPWVGGLVWGLLAISHLNNAFAYSKLNEYKLVNLPY